MIWLLPMALIDIALHMAGAAAFLLLPPIVVNTVFWPLREVIQHWPDWREVFTRKQPFLEWVCPVAFGFIIYSWA